MNRIEIFEVSPISAIWRSKFKKEISPESVEDIVCKYLNIDIKDLMTKDRYRELVYARQLCIVALRLKTALSLKKIGQRFCGRDHTTAIHSIQTIRNLYDTDNIVLNDVTNVLRLIDVDVYKFLSLRKVSKNKIKKQTKIIKFTFREKTKEEVLQSILKTTTA